MKARDKVTDRAGRTGKIVRITRGPDGQEIVWLGEIAWDDGRTSVERLDDLEPVGRKSRQRTRIELSADEHKSARHALHKRQGEIDAHNRRVNK